MTTDTGKFNLAWCLLQPTVTVPIAGKLLGLSRNAAYAAAASGQIPTLRFGRRIVVPTAPLRRMLGLTPEGAVLSNPGVDNEVGSTSAVHRKPIGGQAIPSCSVSSAVITRGTDEERRE
jgi:hypothetical protein